MAKAKKTLSLVMIAIFTTFIVLSGIPASAVTKAAATKQIKTATASVVKAEAAVKVKNFNYKTAQTVETAAVKQVNVVRTYGSAYSKTYAALAKRLTAVQTKINAAKALASKPKILTPAQTAAAKAKAEAAKNLADAQAAVNKAEELTNTDTYDLEGSDTDLQNAQDAVTTALEAVVKLDNESADYKGLMARIDAANANIVKAMEARDEVAAAAQADKDEAANVAAAETAVKAVEDAAAALKTADDLTAALDLGKTALDAVDKVTEADKKADFTTRLTAAGKIATDFKAQLDEATKPVTIKVSAVDGTITVTFSKKPATAPALTDFTVTNGTVAVTPTAIKVVDDTTATLTVPAITATDKDQSVVYSVAYGSAAAVDAAAFTVAKVTNPGVAKVENTATDTLKVTFTAPIDTAKATLSVTKSSVVTAVKTTTWNADKTEATLVFYTALAAGDYVVTLGGVTVDTTKASGTVTVKGSTVTTIEIQGDTAVLQGTTTPGSLTVTVGVILKDQFGTDVTKTTTDTIQASSSAGTGTFSGTNKNLTFTYTTAPTVGDAIVVTVVDTTSFATGSKTLKVGAPSTGSKVTFSALKNVDNKVLRASTVLTTDVFAFDATATDQYGTAMDPTDSTFKIYAPTGVVATWKASTTTDPAKLVISGTSDNGYKIAAGTYTITILPMGNMTAPVSVSFTVADAIALATFQLGQPTALIAVGDSTNLTIPYTAYDQYGTAMTAFSDFTSDNLTINVSDNSTTDGHQKSASNEYHYQIIREANPLDGTLRISLKVLASATAENLVVTAIGGTSHSVSSLTIPVKAKAEPARIAGTASVNVKLGEGATQSLTAADNFVVKDQYERTMSSLDGYTIDLSSDTPDYVTAVTTGSALTDMKITGVAAGSATVTAQLKDNTVSKAVVPNSAYTFTVSTVKKADIASYAIGDIGTVFTTSGAGINADEKAAYAKSLSVYGLTASGDKVTLPTADITRITSTNSKVANSGDLKVAGDMEIAVDTALSTAGTNETGTVVAVVNAANGYITVTKNFTITDAARVGGDIKVESSDTLDGNALALDSTDFDGKYVTKSAEYMSADGLNAPIYFTVLDQYGVDSSAVAPTFYTLSAVDNAGNTVNTDPASADKHYTIDSATGQLHVYSHATGDILTVTGITKDGKVAVLKIGVK